MIFKNTKKLFEYIQKQVDGTVTYDELFNESFIKEHSQFNSWRELFESGGFKCETPEDIKAINEDEFNEYLRNNSSFNHGKI